MYKKYLILGQSTLSYELIARFEHGRDSNFHVLHLFGEVGMTSIHDSYFEKTKYSDASDLRGKAEGFLHRSGIQIHWTGEYEIAPKDDHYVLSYMHFNKKVELSFSRMINASYQQNRSFWNHFVGDLDRLTDHLSADAWSDAYFFRDQEVLIVGCDRWLENQRRFLMEYTKKIKIALLNGAAFQNISGPLIAKGVQRCFFECVENTIQVWFSEERIREYDFHCIIWADEIGPTSIEQFDLRTGDLIVANQSHILDVQDQIEQAQEVYAQFK